MPDSPYPKPIVCTGDDWDTQPVVPQTRWTVYMAWGHDDKMDVEEVDVNALTYGEATAVASDYARTDLRAGARVLDAVQRHGMYL